MDDSGDPRTWFMFCCVPECCCVLHKSTLNTPTCFLFCLVSPSPSTFSVAVHGTAYDVLLLLFSHLVSFFPNLSPSLSLSLCLSPCLCLCLSLCHCLSVSVSLSLSLASLNQLHLSINLSPFFGSLSLSPLSIYPSFIFYLLLSRQLYISFPGVRPSPLSFPLSSIL